MQTAHELLHVLSTLQTSEYPTTPASKCEAVDLLQLQVQVQVFSNSTTVCSTYVVLRINDNAEG